MNTPSEDEIVWHPSADIIENSNLTAFIRAHGLADYDALLARSVAEPEWYWEGHQRRACPLLN